jgi:hypothetical protein
MDITCGILLGAAGVGLAGVIIAYRQLRHVSEQLGLVRKSSTAATLFELDRKYDDIFDARKAARELADGIKHKIPADTVEREEKFLLELTRKMEEIWENNKDQYFLIKKVFDFCEAVGFLMTSGYIAPDDVQGLWGPAINTWGYWFKRHITWRQGQEGEDVYKYFIVAYEELQQKRGKLQTNSSGTKPTASS